MQRAEVRIAGKLDLHWKTWFEGFELTYDETGDTLLTGCVSDQAALYGLMAKLRDIGVKLVAIKLTPDSGKGH